MAFRCGVDPRLLAGFAGCALRVHSSRARRGRAAQSPACSTRRWKENRVGSIVNSGENARRLFLHRHPCRRSEAARIITQSEGARTFLRRPTNRAKARWWSRPISASFGVGGLMVAQMGFPFTVLTYPEPSRALTEWRAAFRRRWNVETIEIGTDSFAFLELAERLRPGKIRRHADRQAPSQRTARRFRCRTEQARFPLEFFCSPRTEASRSFPPRWPGRRDGTYHSPDFPSRFSSRTRVSRAETLQFYSQRIADTFLPVLCAHPEQWYQFVPLSSAS